MLRDIVGSHVYFEKDTKRLSQIVVNQKPLHVSYRNRQQQIINRTRRHVDRCSHATIGN